MTNDTRAALDAAIDAYGNATAREADNARPGYLPDPWGEAAGLLLDGWRPGMAVGR